MSYLISKHEEVVQEFNSILANTYNTRGKYKSRKFENNQFKKAKINCLGKLIVN